MPKQAAAVGSSESGTRGRQVRTLLNYLRRQVRGAIALRFGWQALAAVAGCLWVGLILDRWLEPPPWVRAAALGTASIALIAWLGWVVGPRCLRRLTDRELVTLLQASAPKQAQLIGTALDLQQRPSNTSPILKDATLAAADNAAESLAATRLVRDPAGYGTVWFATTALVGAVALALIRTDLAGSALARLTLAEAPWPRRVELALDGFDFDPDTGEWVRVAARGEPIEIDVFAAVVVGQTPPATVWARGGGHRRGGRSSLSRVGSPVVDDRVRQRYRQRFDRLDENKTISLTGGDARLRLRLIAADRPTLTDVVIACRPPDYLHADEFQSTAGVVATFPEGSGLVIRAGASKPLTDGTALVGGEAAESRSEVSLRLTDDGRSVEAALPNLLGPCVVAIQATDQDGLASLPLEVPIEVDLDTPPTVRIALDGVGRVITRDARLSVVLDVDDDHALDSLTLSLSGGNAPEPVDFSQTTPTDLPSEVLGEIDLLSLRSAAPGRRFMAQPGDRLTLRATASDRYDLADRAPTESQPIELEVVTPAELLARLGDGQRELRRTVEGLLADAQRLQYEIDLESRRRLADEAQAIDEPASSLQRWAAERRLDARKASDGVSAAADRAEGLRLQAVSNRLDQPALIDRLAADVVGPLRRAAARDLSAAQQRLQDLQTDDAADRLAEAAAEVARATATLDRVAASLDSQQGYNEVVALLRGLVREQRRVNEKTNREKAQSVRGLFD